MRSLTDILGHVFGWRFSSVFGVAWWFAGVGAMIGDKYVAALIFYAIGGLWLFGWWLVEHPSPRRREAQQQWTRNQKKQIQKRWFGAMAPIAITAIMCMWTLHLKTENELRQHDGTLYAGSEPSPPNPCAVPDGFLTIFIGTNASFTSSFPHTVLQINQEKILAINKGKDGKLYGMFRIFDDRGEILARMPSSPENNSTYWVRPDSRMYRKDLSSLTVYDRRDVEVLDIDFLNSSSVSVRGIFREPSDPKSKVVITKTELITPSGSRWGNCVGNNGGPDTGADIFIGTH
jgi:hypothetical protein